MSIKKTLATLMAGSMMAGLALVATAGSAAAVDEGPVLPGGIYWFSTVGSLASQTPATQVFGGTSATTGGPTGNGRPWVSLTTENACPAGTATMVQYVRIPQAGVPENDWVQVQMGAVATLKDADGRFYTTTTGQADRLSKSEVITYLNANSGTGTFPFLSTCHDAAGNPLGVFRTTLAMTGLTAATLSWTLDTPLFEGIKADSTTTLAVSASTVELGTSVDLTATVAPAAGTGSVEFFNGATSLGTAPVTAGVAVLSTTALPVGAASITAVYSGDAAYKTSTSAPAAVTVTAVAARTTTTTLAVSPVSGDAYAPVTFTTTVVASAGAANGTVTFKDGAVSLGSVPVVGGVVADFTTNVLGAGAHSLVAEFVGTAPYSSSTSAPVAADYVLAGAVDEQTVTVSIPAGTISITTPYTPAAPLALGTAVLDPSDSTFSASAPFENIVITDTRAGNLGFNASVVSGSFVNAAGESFGGGYAGLTDLSATQVVGNALLASDVIVTNHVPATDGLDVPKVFASYPANRATGTAHLQGTFGIDQVPTSVKPGLYTATVTFT
ncbi:MAG: Ig-like domain repeat protein, partial [Cellulomonadaceae bacterium]|nr:Ig-like domain repeat protein [Cellulomonadaceae bacterium]